MAIKKALHLEPGATTSEFEIHELEPGVDTLESVVNHADFQQEFSIVARQSGTVPVSVVINEGELIGHRTGGTIQGLTPGQVRTLLNVDQAGAYTGLLAAIQLIDGPGSGIDADTLDGRHLAFFSPEGHAHSGVYVPAGQGLPAGGLDGDFLVKQDDSPTSYNADWQGVTGFNLVSESSPALGANLDLAGFQIVDGVDPVIYWDGTTVRIAGQPVVYANVDASPGDLLVYDGTNFVDLNVGTDGQVLKVNSAADLGVEWGTDAGGAGSTTFRDLTDTPSSFIANNVTVVNGAGTALEFVTDPTIGDFTNAGHDHADAAGGGAVLHASLTNAGTRTHAEIDAHIAAIPDDRNIWVAENGSDTTSGLPAWGKTRDDAYLTIEAAITAADSLSPAVTVLSPAVIRLVGQGPALGWNPASTLLLKPGLSLVGPDAVIADRGTPAVDPLFEIGEDCIVQIARAASGDGATMVRRKPDTENITHAEYQGNWAAGSYTDGQQVTHNVWGGGWYKRYEADTTTSLEPGAPEVNWAADWHEIYMGPTLARFYSDKINVVGATAGTKLAEVSPAPWDKLLIQSKSITTEQDAALSDSGNSAVRGPVSLDVDNWFFTFDGAGGGLGVFGDGASITGRIGNPMWLVRRDTALKPYNSAFIKTTQTADWAAGTYNIGDTVWNSGEFWINNTESNTATPGPSESTWTRLYIHRAHVQLQLDGGELHPDWFGDRLRVYAATEDYAADVDIVEFGTPTRYYRCNTPVVASAVNPDVSSDFDEVRYKLIELEGGEVYLTGAGCHGDIDITTERGLVNVDDKGLRRIDVAGDNINLLNVDGIGWTPGPAAQPTLGDEGAETSNTVANQLLNSRIIGTLATSSLLSDLSDVFAYTKDAGTDGYVITYDHSNLRFDLMVAPGAAGGEANTASNQGATGVGVFDGKVASDLQFRNVDSLHAGLTVALEAVGNTIDLNLVEGSIDHDALSNFVADEHIAHSGVTVTAGDGMSGGGTIDANLTLTNADRGSTAVATHAALTTTHGLSGLIVGTTDVQTLTNKTLTLPTIGATSFTNANHAHTGGSSGGALDAAAINTGTFADALVAESNVTQHIGAINHDAALNFVADEHVAHGGVTLTAGEGLTGGGTIAANRTFDLDINGLTTDASPDTAADYVVYYDSTEGAHNKCLIDSLGVGGGGAPASAQYVTLATDATLTVERVLTAGTAISVVDGGAGSTVTINNTDLGSTAVATHAALDTGIHGVGAGDIVGTTLSQTLTNKTLTLPTIGGTSFTNANHAHTGSSSGGALGAAAIASGEFPTARYADESVTLAKMAHIATTSILGRVTAATGDVEVLTAANARTVMDVPQTTRDLIAGEGLTGGGTLAADRTFDLDINSLTTDAAPDINADFLVFYDTTEAAHNKVLITDIQGGAGGNPPELFPRSALPKTAAKVYPLIYIGQGSEQDDEELYGVMASVDADSTWLLVWQIPPALPTGTMKLLLRARANATSGAAKVNPTWKAVAATEEPSTGAKTAEGTQTFTWAAGEADDWKESKITMDAVTAAAGDRVYMDLVFETTSWTLAVESGWEASIIWE